jgi:hypothetical protein
MFLTKVFVLEEMVFQQLMTDYQEILDAADNLQKMAVFLVLEETVLFSFGIQDPMYHHLCGRRKY